ncbi:hypothetical protein BN1708_020553, partial [Verticillium longisporum]
GARRRRRPPRQPLLWRRGLQPPAHRAPVRHCARRRPHRSLCRRPRARTRRRRHHLRHRLHLDAALPAGRRGAQQPRAGPVPARRLPAG